MLLNYQENRERKEKKICYCACRRSRVSVMTCRAFSRMRAVQVNNGWAELSPISLYCNTDYIHVLLMNILETNAQAVDEIMSFARFSQCVNTDS